MKRALMFLLILTVAFAFAACAPEKEAPVAAAAPEAAAPAATPAAAPTKTVYLITTHDCPSQPAMKIFFIGPPVFAIVELTGTKVYQSMKVKTSSNNLTRLPLSTANCCPVSSGLGNSTCVKFHITSGGQPC